MERNILQIGENVDQLITVDMSARRIIGQLYRAARGKNEMPLTLAAAQKLVEVVRKKSMVYILTGFQCPKWSISETDGPPGAVILARGISLGLEALPVIVTDDINVPMIKATAHAAALNVLENKVVEDPLSRTVAVIGIPIKEKMEEKAGVLLDSHKPSVVIAIERPGWNEKHVYHRSIGFDISHLNAHLDHIYDEAHKRSIPTIGIGDGGNELGMGNIAETTKQIVPYGAKCQCPCGAGIAAVNKSDFIVPATVSNWGGYGIVACLSALLKKPAEFHDRKIQLRIIHTCAAAGAVDGTTQSPEPSEDGVPAEVSAGLIEMLNLTVSMALKTPADSAIARARAGTI